MYKSPRRSKNCAQELSENITNSKCMLTPTNLLLVMCSHRDMLANPGIVEGGVGGGGYNMYISRGSGGMPKKFLRFLMYHERASGAISGSDASLKTIKWPFLD